MSNPSRPNPSRVAPAAGTVSDAGTHVWDSDRWGWQPLWLTATEAQAAIRDRFGIGTEATAEYLGSGMLNQSWRIGDHVLRVSRTERSTEQIRYEHEVLRRLHERAPEVLAPVAGIDGESLQSAHGRRLTVFDYVEGTVGADLPSGLRLRPTADLTATLHRESLHHLAMPQRPGFTAADDRRSWLWPRLAPMLRREVDGVHDCFTLFDEETRLIDRWFDRFRGEIAALPRAVVQGDTNPRNLIFADGRIVAAIDWDDCCVELLHAAVAREAYAADGTAESFWDCYLRAGGPLPAGSFDLLSGFARLGTFIELIWTDQSGRVNPYAAETIRGVAEDIERMRARVAL